jgi:hypothetical protein
MGVRFMEGVGHTDDGVKVHTALEYGYAVLDRATGKWTPGSTWDPKAQAWVPDEALPAVDASNDGTVRSHLNR